MLILAVPWVLEQTGDKVLVHYTGCLAKDGRCFDSSRARGHAFTFPIGCNKMIKGWDSLLLKVRTTARMIWPMSCSFISPLTGAERQPS